MLRLPNAFVSITWTCGLGALLVAYHYAESSLQLLRSALEKHKGWLAVFWATVNVCFLLNIYTILKMIASACMDAKARDCSYGIIAILAGIALSGIPVIVHVRMSWKGSWGVFLSCDRTTPGESFCPGIERLQGSHSVLG